MTKMHYESPELEIRWFESEDVISVSDEVFGGEYGDNFGDDW